MHNANNLIIVGKTPYLYITYYSKWISILIQDKLSRLNSDETHRPHSLVSTFPGELLGQTGHLLRSLSNCLCCCDQIFLCAAFTSVESISKMHYKKLQWQQRSHGVIIGVYERGDRLVACMMLFPILVEAAQAELMGKAPNPCPSPFPMICIILSNSSPNISTNPQGKQPIISIQTPTSLTM